MSAETLMDAGFPRALELARGKTALLIAGPTSSGKSALAIAVAKATGGVVVNADSMQIYDGLRILTARPTLEEEAEVEHHLYGCVDPRIAFSTGDYLRLITPVIADLSAKGRLAVITGGTGLYFRALTEGLVKTPEIPPHVMDEVVAVGDGPALHAWLSKRDPARAAELQPADLPRLQRAASVWLATGRSMKEWHADQQPAVLAEGSWAGLFLSPPREWIYSRIDARFHKMIAAGALDEARAIAALNLPANRGVMKAHGIPHLIRYLSGEMLLHEAIRLGQQDTRNYARRQGVWARRFMGGWAWAAPSA
jgi:tRNA dimethylallyltransferase